MSQAVNITSPVGRLVMGSCYKPRDKDAEGKPLVIKTGPNAGQPRVDYFLALAIPKGQEQHWAQTEWGSKVWAVGHAAFPQAAQAQDFSWKVIDGDSAQPGKLFKGKPGKAPRENEGWPGHWILKLSGGFAPGLYKARPGVPGQHDPFNDPDGIKLGYYVQINFNVESNKSQTSPGVYLNHRMVCFAAFGPEISVGPDVASAGFGQSALPAGATLTPPANFNPGQPAAAPIPGQAAIPPIPGSAPAPVPVAGYAPAAGAMPPPVMAAAPVAAPSYSVSPQYAASGHTVDSLAAAAGGHAQALAQGWIVQAVAAAPALPATPPLPPVTSVPVPGVPGAPIAPAGVAPNPGFVAIPGQPAAGMAPAPVPVPAARRVVMNPGQQPYEVFKSAGWQDDAIVGGGYGQWAA